MVLSSSISGTTNVFCDGSGCPNWTSGVSGSKGMARAARAQAKASGWAYVRQDGQMVDLCPECSANVAQGTKKALFGDTE